MSTTTRTRQGAAMVLPPVAFGLIFVGLWQAWVMIRDVQPYVIPKPTAIVQALFEDPSLVTNACMVTGVNALVGLIVGAILGFVGSALTNRFRLVAELVNPLAVTVAAVPAVVIVGVLNNMYALDSQIGRRIMVSIAVFFIVFVQVTKGLTQNDPTQIELMQSYAASPRQVMAKVRVPNTLPFFFTAIRTAAPIAVIIALVSEYFGGTQDGLGTKIASTLNGSNKALGFAYVVGGSIVGLLFFAGANLLEYLVVPWQRRRRTG
ncbi:MAG: NitT/TauT family transport system permease protein [Ilumatobacteraceae bacterium]|jgi:NitT/TauT family transport system permease protein|nr:NitT/TauT family transport system permease protein [Ilumatobacteraceae bacterium]